MMLIRVIAALLFTAAGGAFGCMRSEQLRRRTEVCHQAEELMRVCEFHIRYDGADVYALSGLLKNSGSFGRLSFIQGLPAEFEPEQSFSSSWSAALHTQPELPDDEREILTRFGSVLGSADTEGQIRQIEGLIGELERLEDRRMEEYLRKGKLYRSLGLLTGVLAAVLVL